MAYSNYMYTVDRSEEYLEHYGIKGMKWGVRKALASGNSRKLDRVYRKTQRKLAKLERQANSGAKYAKRAAALGAGAAAAGGLAVAGTQGVASGMRAIGRVGNAAAKGVGNAMDTVGRGLAERHGKVGSIGSAMAAAGRNIRRNAKFGSNNISSTMNGASQAVQDWGRGSSSIAQKASRALRDNEALHNIGRGYHGINGQAIRDAGAGISKKVDSASKRLNKVTNDQVARLGAAALGAGLAGAAGYNAYRAATTKRAARKANEMRSEAQKAFAGTKYANSFNGSTSNSGNRKRKRNSRRG